MMKIYKTLLVLLVACSTVSLQSYAQDKQQLDSLAYTLVNTMLATEIKDLRPDPDSLQTINMRREYGDSVRLFYRYLDGKVPHSCSKYNYIPFMGIYSNLTNKFWRDVDVLDTIADLTPIKVEIEDCIIAQVDGCYKYPENDYVEEWDQDRLILDDSYIFTPNLAEERSKFRRVLPKYDFRTGKPIPWKRTDPEYEGWVKSNAPRYGWRISYPAFFQYEGTLYALITIQFDSLTAIERDSFGYLYKWEEQEWKKVYRD